MEVTCTDLVSLFKEALEKKPSSHLDEIGIVVTSGDNICHVHGLTNVMYHELVLFDGGNKGIVLHMDEYSVAIFLLYRDITVSEQETVKRTGHVYKAPVGMSLCGRVIDVTGKPIDGKGPLTDIFMSPIETIIPGIIERSPVNESLETGILAIDALVPIGKGQRELLIGNRSSGKTSIALDTIMHQKGKNVLCIYVAIGQRQANVARTIQMLQENDALDYTVIVCADASEAVLTHYLAPYVGCTVGEYFRDQGHDALIVYDDLSNHAVAFREMSLLLRRSPGREAYPGDVFYLHSRLLERAGKLLKGGSLTALPIVQIQSDDITAYIPTNLISITDGQIFLDTKLFNQGIRPAVNAELSVSRVGGAAQTRAIKKTARSLRLELAQYQDLLSFAQFGTELDEVSRRKLTRGARTVEILKQPEHLMYSFVDSSLILFLLQEGFLDSIDLKQVRPYISQFTSYIKSVYRDLHTIILTTADITAETHAQLREIAQEFTRLFVPPTTE